MKQFMYSFFYLVAFSLIQPNLLHAQTTLNLPRESQFAQVKQRIGITDIEVTYHSPAVKGRKVLGGIVPYDQIWRAGANENTVITFTHEVHVEGSTIAAGSYGLHMIPGVAEWTIIFSKSHTSWGSYFYKKDEDALRVKVKSKAHTFTEWLSYEFSERSATSTILSLVWENIEVPVKLTVDVKKEVLASIHNQLRSEPGFSWQGWYDAAKFCFDNNFNFEEAEKWINTADKSNPGHFAIQSLKADILEKRGETEAAKAVMKKAMETGKESELNAYGYQLLNSGKTKEALEIFRLNVKKYPQSWNAYDSLAEALVTSGDTKGGKENYQLALKKAPEDQKTRIQKILEALR